MDDSKLLQERKEKALAFLKVNYNWITYILLALIVYLSVWIRTRNLPLLRDITTGGWTLGPDLDPFLFLRWAKEIIANGSLQAIDYTRYVPLGYDTKGELLLHPYMIAWFHKIAVIFGSVSVEQSAAIFPVLMFALTVAVFFFFVRKLFLGNVSLLKSNIIALIASFFLAVIPVILPRTIAGIPEKEASGFFFMFLAFYLFIYSWKSDNLKKGLIFGALSGLATAGMALVWGGYVYIFLTIAGAYIFAFLLGQIDKEKFYLYVSWIVPAFIIMNLFSTRYSINELLFSIATSAAVLGLVVSAAHLVLYHKFKDYYKKGFLNKIPEQLVTFLGVIILGVILASILLGPDFIFGRINNILDLLITPSSERVNVTVAENKQPFFWEWASSFGPFIRKIPIYFWLFFAGSIYLFNKMIDKFDRKEKNYLTLAYSILLLSIVFSRYRPDSLFNGTNSISLLFYSAGFLLFSGLIGYYYYTNYKSSQIEKFKSIDFSLIFIFVFFFLTIISARGAIRLVMLLVPSSSIIVSYFIVNYTSDIKNKKPGLHKSASWIIIILLIVSSIFAGYAFYSESTATAKAYAPSIYTQQWQKAMSWVRDNTPENAVFAHWWDYGYWVQSIGERATVLDGGNSISYWNHFMGRYALTGSSNKDALEFLYAHNSTHFLIDSSDIGKYGAFASIGSNEEFDRVSYIPTFSLDKSKMQEKKKSIVFAYIGGAGLDEDISYDLNGTRIYLPKGKAGIGAILIEKDSSGNIIKNPEAIFVYQGRQYQVPLRYVYQNKELIDFGYGLESGIFLIPRVANGNQIEMDGTLMYLSKRVVKTQFARLYLYNENNPNFRLVHSEDDLVVAQVKEQNPAVGDFLDYQGIRGPIRIWEINYPKDIQFVPKYLNTTGSYNE